MKPVFKFASFLLLLALSAIPRAYADYWCPPEGQKNAREKGECIFDASPSKVKAFEHTWYKARKQEAAGLSSNFEDIVFAFLSDGATSKKQAYCLVLFDDRPSAALTRRLRLTGENPLYCRSGVANLQYIYRISQLSKDTFLLNVGSYYGPLGAAEHLITMRRDDDGAFVVEQTDLVWIS